MADNTLPAGDYHILNVSNTNLALDLAGNKTANRSNIQVGSANYSDAQVWAVSYRKDGTCQILHRYSGKSMEVYGLNLSQGANVSLWSDNDGDAQQWTLRTTGNKVTYGGVQYDSYYILLDQVKGNAYTWMVECVGRNPTSGTNVCIARWTNAEAAEHDRHWIFVPIPKYKEGGVYTIHSVMDPKMVFAITGSSKANGANLLLASPNSQNNQKFVLVKSGSYWALRSVHSGKYLRATSAANGANVRQMAGMGSDLALFSVVEYGTKKVDGKVCQVVSFNLKGHSSLVIDAEGAKTSKNTNLMLGTNNQGANQEWAIKPTDALDANMPVPHSLGLALKVGGAGATTRHVQSYLYPTWKCSDAWVTSGPNHYQWRYRRRYMSSYSSSWGSWSAWSAWREPGVTIKGQQAWVTEGIVGTYQWSSYKNLEFQFEVRSVGVASSGTQNLRSGVASATCRVVRQPSVTISRDVLVDPNADGIGFSPEGIRMDYTSDYEHGKTGFRIIDILGANGSSIVKTWQKRYKQGGDKKEWIAPVTKNSDGDSSVLIESSILTRWPRDNELITIKYAPYYDQWQDFGGQSEMGVTQTSAVRVYYDHSEGVSAEPTLVGRPDRTILATVPHIGTERMWIKVGKSVAELDRTVSGNVARFVVPYPFNQDFELYTTVVSTNGDQWGTDLTEVPQTHSEVAKYPPCHVWTWGSSSAVIELSEGAALHGDYKLQAEYKAMVLTDRERDAISFSSVSHGRLEAEGVLVPGLSNSTAAAFEGLVGQHATYRSPLGRVADVAVVDVQVVEMRDYTTVSVSMVEEEV